MGGNFFCLCKIEGIVCYTSLYNSKYSNSENKLQNFREPIVPFYVVSLNSKIRNPQKVCQSLVTIVVYLEMKNGLQWIRSTLIHRN